MITASGTSEWRARRVLRWMGIGSLTFCSACGQTSSDEGSDGSGGTGGTANATGGASGRTSSGGAAEDPNDCVSNGGFGSSSRPTIELPTTVETQLCEPRGEDWFAFDETADDAYFSVPIAIRLLSGSGRGPYTVSLFGVDQGVVQPLPNAHETHVFALDESAPEVVFARRIIFSERFIVLKLEGPGGDVTFDLHRLQLPPYDNCGGAYESLPPEAPPVSPPTVIEAVLCNFRDSLSWGLQVVGGRAVRVTLENPLSIENFSLGVYRLDVPGFQELPITAGSTQATLGLVAQRTLTFTPQTSGTVGLYASSGASRGEPFRLSIQQE